MAFRNFPFPDDVTRFPWHYQVLAYLQDYAEKKGLNCIISYNTRVLSVYHTPSNTDPAKNWTIETERTEPDGTRTRHTRQASHVILSNGHYNEPWIPVVPGLETWRSSGRELFHARWWRNPFSLRGKNVLVVGSRASGSDIARELAVDDYTRRKAGESITRKIYQSIHGKPDPNKPVYDADLAWAKEIDICAEIESVDAPSIRFIDGGAVNDVDVIIYATGYLFSYPFLSRAPFDTHPVTHALAPPQTDIPRAGGQTISNLNITDTFYTPDPTLALVNLHYQVNPFPLGEITSRLIAYAYTHAEIPALRPLERRTGSTDPHDIVISFPQEFNNCDMFLEAIGEGGDDGGPRRGWKRTPDSLRAARADALKLRKEYLGY